MLVVILDGGAAVTKFATFLPSHYVGDGRSLKSTFSLLFYPDDSTGLSQHELDGVWST